MLWRMCVFGERRHCQEESISALCRREGISESLYYSWSKEFLEAGKRFTSEKLLAFVAADRATWLLFVEARIANRVRAPAVSMNFWLFDIHRQRIQRNIHSPHNNFHNELGNP